MSTLRIRVNKYIPSDGGPPPNVFAKIRKIEDSSGSTSSVSEKLIPISNQATAALSIPMEPGPYFVEVRLPSGEILSDNVRVPLKGSSELVLEADDSPHEWLGWQHLMGNVASKANTSISPTALKERMLSAPSVEYSEKSSGRFAVVATKGRSPRGGVGSLKTGNALLKRVTTPSDGDFGRQGSSASNLLLRPTSSIVDIGSPIYWINNLSSILSSTQWTVDTWKSLSSLKGSPSELLKKLNGGKACRSIKTFASDKDYAVYLVTHGSHARSGAIALKSNFPRDFCVVERSKSLELLSLPTPWLDLYRGVESVVEIVVQEPVREFDFATSIAVRDERLGILLGFLSSGAMPAAKKITDTAVELLFQKTQNPLAAAAGGYALVGTAIEAEEQDWHQWIRNLMNYFPHIPDGAILYA
ncbi:MAG: hypothetical protein ACREO1_07595, partial [Arenimonas sp.]